MNVLNPHWQTIVRKILQTNASQREIERIKDIYRHIPSVPTYKKRFVVNSALLRIHTKAKHL